MKILIVEDEFLLGDATREALHRDFPKAQIQCVANEREFREGLPQWAMAPPAVVIMDIKLPWQALTEDRIRAPKDVRKEGNRRAGLRCHEILRRQSCFDSTHVIFYSVFLTPALKKEIDHLGEVASHLEKVPNSGPSDKAFDRLIERVHECIVKRKDRLATLPTP